MQRDEGDEIAAARIALRLLRAAPVRSLYVSDEAFLRAYDDWRASVRVMLAVQPNS